MCCCAIHLNAENIGWNCPGGVIQYLATDHIVPPTKHDPGQEWGAENARSRAHHQAAHLLQPRPGHGWNLQSNALEVAESRWAIRSEELDRTTPCIASCGGVH